MSRGNNDYLRFRDSLSDGDIVINGEIAHGLLNYGKKASVPSYSQSNKMMFYRDEADRVTRRNALIDKCDAKIAQANNALASAEAAYNNFLAQGKALKDKVDAAKQGVSAAKTDKNKQLQQFDGLYAASRMVKTTK